MSLSQTYISRKQLIADNLNTVGVADASVNDGLTTLANKILNASATANTSLTIDVPLNLVYGDDFNITGILSDSNGNLLGGQTVKLLVGSTVVDTSTTDNDGEVSFTRSPVSMGNHSFQLVFDGVSTGGSTYSPCQSSIVSRVINKETSVLNLTNPSGSLTVYTDGYFTVAGTLKEDDGVAMANKNIIVSDGTNTLATLTTSSDGSFNGSVNIPNAGNYTLTVSYGGDTYYTGSSVSRSITVNPVELNFALTDGSDILSYADEQQTPNSQYATFTATFVGANIVNQAVELYKDNVLWDTLYTDNTGKVSKTYYSEGVGDIEFKAVKGTLVTETYDVVDGLLYRNGNVLIETPIPINFPSKYEVSYKVLKKSTSSCVGTCNISDGTHILGTGSFGSNASIGFGYNNGSSWSPLKTLTNINLNTEYLLTSVYDNGTFTTSINGQSDTISQSLNPTQISIGIASQTKIVFKDLLIKPL